VAVSTVAPARGKNRELVRGQGGDDSVVFIATNMNGTIQHAIPAAVCMAILEYYAFEAKGVDNTKAANSSSGSDDPGRHSMVMSTSPGRCGSLLMATRRPDTRLLSVVNSKKRPDAAVPPGKFDGELLLSRLWWRWAEDAGHQGHCKNVIEYAAFLRCARTSDHRRHP
jgi:hypothetical protein